MTDTLFHMIFVFAFLVFTGIRMYYHRKAYKTAGQVTYKEGRVSTALRALFGFPYILTIFAYMVYPPILKWASITMPDELRWVGAVFSLAALPLILWVQRALGSNFSTRLHIRDEHTLVTSGPYRWVRHPMYTVFIVQSTGLLLLTANWFVGGVYIFALMMIVVFRTPFEESAMLEKFGQQYRTYMNHTGKFFPKLTRE